MHGRNAKLINRYFPAYRAPKSVYQEVLQQSVDADTVWLDIGCGKRICSDEALNRQLPRRAHLVVGIDGDSQLSRHSSIRNLVLCDAAALPFRPGIFTLVTASMAVEHLEKPEEVFREVGRVCRPQARVVVYTPNRFNYAMLVASVTPYRFHVFCKKLMNYLARREWRDFGEDLFPTWYRANSVRRLRRLMREAAFSEQALNHLSFAHSFGFVRPLYITSLLFERLIDTLGLNVLKADILGIFVRQPDGASIDGARDERREVAVGGR